MGSLEALVSSSWQGAVLALLVGAFCRLAPKTPPRYRAFLWWAVSLKMALAVLAPATLALPLLAPTEAVAAPSSVIGPEALLSPASSGRREWVPAQMDRMSFEVPLRLVWFAGITVLLLAHLRQARRLQGVIERSQVLKEDDTVRAARSLSAALRLKRAPKIRLSDEIDTPQVARIWRPVVLLPVRFVEESTAEEISMALTHELAHIRSRDLAQALVPTLAGLLLWFHPASWIAARQWTAEREADCDAVALLVTGGSPAVYGELLLRVAESGRRPAFGIPSALGATAAFQTLRKRVENMRQHALRPSRQLRAAGLAAVSVALLAALPWSVTAQTARKDPKKASRVLGTWTATRPVLGVVMRYTFRGDGRYLAIIGEMDHQGDYRIEGHRVVLKPDVVAQRAASVFLKEQAKNPDGLSPSELTYIKRLAKPYAMTLNADGKSIRGLDFVAKLDPKAKPLF